MRGGNKSAHQTVVIHINNGWELIAHHLNVPNVSSRLDKVTNTDSGCPDTIYLIY